MHAYAILCHRCTTIKHTTYEIGFSQPYDRPMTIELGYQKGSQPVPVQVSRTLPLLIYQHAWIAEAPSIQTWRLLHIPTWFGPFQTVSTTERHVPTAPHRTAPHVFSTAISQPGTSWLSDVSLAVVNSSWAWSVGGVGREVWKGRKGWTSGRVRLNSMGLV